MKRQQKMKIVCWNKIIELNKFEYILIQIALQVEKWHGKKGAKFRRNKRERERESGKCK